jgi:hypothetical protein
MNMSVHSYVGMPVLFNNKKAIIKELTPDCGTKIQLEDPIEDGDFKYAVGIGMTLRTIDDKDEVYHPKYRI